MSKPKKPEVPMATVKIGLRSGGVVIIGDTVDVSQVTLNDLAYGLATLPRFSGQLDRPYSVGEHSIILSELASCIPQKIASLFHDTAECLGFNDVNRFLKTPEARKAEERVLAAIFKKFKVPEFTEHELDHKLGDHEATTFHPAKSHFGTPPADIRPYYRHYRSITDCAEKWKQLYEVYLDSLDFKLPPLAKQFDINVLYNGYPGILPQAIKAEVEKVPGITKISETVYKLKEEGPLYVVD